MAHLVSGLKQLVISISKTGVASGPGSVSSRGTEVPANMSGIAVADFHALFRRG